MRARTSAASVGMWAGGGFAALSLVYLVVLTVMMARGLPFPPQEPFTTTFHAIMMLAVLIMVPLWCAVHFATPPDRQLFTLISLAFIVMLAVVVCANRFVALTMVRQSPGLGRTAGLEWFQPYGWPSLTFAFEVLGWGCSSPWPASSWLRRSVRTDSNAESPRSSRPWACSAWAAHSGSSSTPPGSWARSRRWHGGWAPSRPPS
ncbi:hypothetical protein ACFQYP_01665 [Nonomuraea antimicrobica]